MERQTLFFDPYLEYTSSSGEALLYPVPVLITNTDSNGGADTTQWQFVRRFFLVENEALRDGGVRRELRPLVGDCLGERD